MDRFEVDYSAGTGDSSSVAWKGNRMVVKKVDWMELWQVGERVAAMDDYSAAW